MGATYSALPADVWPELGLQPQRTITFSLADGTQISRQASECRSALEGAEAHSPVVLGEPADEALLGTVTLETLGLVLDPLKRTLQPMQMLLA